MTIGGKKDKIEKVSKFNRPKKIVQPSLFGDEQEIVENYTSSYEYIGDYDIEQTSAGKRPLMVVCRG